MPELDHAVTFTAHKKAELLTIERDEGPLGTDEIAGRTLATLISAGTEISGGYLGSSFPMWPGYAAVFVVEEVGTDVTDFHVGDLAFVMGPHCAHQRTKAGDALRVPSELEPADATFARMMSVSMSTLTTTKARPPQPVLITGLGPIGHMAARVFAGAGYQVTGCDPSADRRNLLMWRKIDAIAETSGLEVKPALAIDCSGHEKAVLDCCRAVKKGGEVVLIGVPWRRLTELYAHDILHAVFHNYVHLRSGWEWELPRQETEFQTGSIQDNLAGALRWLSEKRVDVTGLFETRLPNDCAAVYDDLANNRTKSLAIVFDWT